VLTLPPTVRLFLCTQPIDCRRGFDGLCALVKQQLHLEPLSGHLFIFRNRTGERLKILYWDRDGLAVWYKRLEQGTFKLPTLENPLQPSLEISAAELAMLLEGVDLDSAKRHKRYRRAQTT
jgi:transposase